MKRIILLSVLSLALMACLSAVNCSNPLEAGGPDPFREIDTVFRTDTFDIIVPDTLIVTDTLIQADTVYLADEPFTICSIILCNLNELIWTFGNDAGTYDLLFAITVEKQFNFHELIFTVGDDEYRLKPSESLELHLTDIDLPENVTIRIKPDVPLVLGHQVDVCLAMYELED